MPTLFGSAFWPFGTSDAFSAEEDMQTYRAANVMAARKELYAENSAFDSSVRTSARGFADLALQHGLGLRLLPERRIGIDSARGAGPDDRATESSLDQADQIPESAR
jgi:hypothetical protein